MDCESLLKPNAVVTFNNPVELLQGRKGPFQRMLN